MGVHPIGRRLRLAGRSEDRAAVVLQHLKPGGDIGGMIGTRIVRDAEVGKQERGGQLGGRFLHRERVLGPPGAEIPVEPMRRAAGMGTPLDIGAAESTRADRTNAVSGKSVLVGVDRGGRTIIKKKKKK